MGQGKGGEGSCPSTRPEKASKIIEIIVVGYHAERLEDAPSQGAGGRRAQPGVHHAQ